MGQKRFLGITGTNNSGKETFVKCIKENKELGLVRHFSVSEFAEKMANERNIFFETRDHFKDFMNNVRKVDGGDFFVKHIHQSVNHSEDNELIIIESIRCLDEVVFLKEHNIPLIGINASSKKRHERSLVRNTKKDTQETLEEFLQQEESECYEETYRQNLPVVLRKVNMLILNNYNSYDSFYDTIRKEHLPILLEYVSKGIFQIPIHNGGIIC